MFLYANYRNSKTVIFAEVSNSLHKKFLKYEIPPGKGQIKPMGII